MGFLASPIIQQILAGIQAAINAAPQVEGIVTSGIALFKSLFEAGVISAATQDATALWITAVAAMVKSGNIPPAWQVQPDPGTAATVVVVAPAPVVTASTVAPDPVPKA